MGTLTANEAIDKLYNPATSGEYNSVQSLIDLVRKTTGAVPGATATTEFLTYGGNMLPDGGAGTEVWRTAGQAVVANDNLVWINNSEVAQLLNSRDFRLRLSTVSGYETTSPEFKALFNGTTDVNGTRIPNGLWDIASENYILDSQSGKFRMFAPFAPDDGVLSQTEMAAMYKRAQDANVHTSLEFRGHNI